jgi:RNA recognition motif-containing protein
VTKFGDYESLQEEKMNNKLYVGGLAYSVTDQELNNLCGQYGNVESAIVVKDRETNNSRGFGFVEMSTQEEAEKAIQALNGSDLQGRELKVNIAKPRSDRPRGGGRY